MNKSIIILFYISILLFINSFRLFSQDYFDAEKLWKINRIGAPAVSPDGNFTAYTVTEYNIEKNQPNRNIFLLNNKTKEITQLTYSGKVNSPSWNPDSNKLAFISNREDEPNQLFVLNLETGGEAKKITELPVGVYSPKWFPCGTKIAFAANILPEYNGDWDKLKNIINEKKESKVTAKVTENTMYRFWDRWLTDEYFSRLFKIDLNNYKITDLMPEINNYFNMMGGVSYTISPDGKTIALSMNNTKPPFDRLNYDIFLLNTDGSGKIINITPDNEADDYNPVYSNCGKYIAYGKQSIYHFYADKVVLTIYDVNNNTHTKITKDIDLSCEQWFWSENSKTIYFLSETRSMKSIFSISINGDNLKELFRGGTNNNAALANNNKIIFNHQNITAANEIYQLDINSLKIENLSRLNYDLLKNITWGSVEDIIYKGANGSDVQMFIIYPPDYNSAKKYPLVMLIHGGPHGTFGDMFHFRWNAQVFAAAGYIVAMPNFHGSTSFGQDFAISIHGNHASKPFRDIMKAADYLIDKNLVDPNKMAAAGGSYGGYLVSWIAGNTDRFACLINHAGVYDLHLQFASDYSGNRQYQYGGTPFENYEQLNANNPSQFAENFKTPMLIIHGQKDYRVPVAHAFLVYGIYKSMGLDARLIYFPDENHWILTPQNSIFWYNEFLNWLNRYLK